MSSDFMAMKSRRMKFAEHVARMEKMRTKYKILVGKPREKEPLERRRHTLEDDDKTDRKETAVNWIHLGRIRSSGGFL
jgi:hypothetical protein